MRTLVSLTKLRLDRSIGTFGCESSLDVLIDAFLSLISLSDSLTLILPLLLGQLIQVSPSLCLS